MKLSRNASCHCGSGKKYKHCHMQADMEQEREQRNAAHSLFSDEQAEEDTDVVSEDDELTSLYEEFSAASHNRQKSILRTAIEEKLLDGELTFEFFNTLYEQMVKAGEREEFAELVDLLQIHQPEMYAEENHWFWSWEVINALALQDDEALQHAVDQLFENGGQDLDQFFPVFNCLLYHDRRAQLLHSLEKYQVQIAEGKYFPGTEIEVNEKIADFLILDYIETTPQSELLNPDHFEKLCSILIQYIPELLRDGLTDFIAGAGGLASKQWSINDFQFTSQPKQRRRDWDEENGAREKDPAIINLRDLSNEFLYFARHTENIPLTKADLARGNFISYILERHQGELQDDDSNGWGKKKPKKVKNLNLNTISRNLLLPDHATLDRYLVRFYGFLANGTYEGATFFEMIPTWTRFLQTKGLATQEECQQALRSLQALSQSMIQILEQRESDPELSTNASRWRDNAGV